MSDIDTIREALQWIISKSRSLGEYHSTLDPETAHGLIVEIPHECNEALAALDRIQAQRQSNAEPVAWMLKREDPLAPSLFTKWEVMRRIELRRNKEEEFIPLYTHPPASTEHPSYVYSRDYEALYDLLMRGGEAIGKDYGGRPFRAERHIDNILLCVQYSSNELFGVFHGREAFLSSCKRLQLEWIAPSTEPRLTVEQAMDACAAANVEWSNGGYKGTKKREWADEYKRMLRDRLTKAAKP